ncbi:hypothetical protein [Dorea longicatena]|nr:hypothetical protein [Dorea longicatena]
MFSNKDLKNLIVPLFLEQLLMALVGIVDVFVIGFVGAALYRSFGKTSTTMYISVIANILNVVGNCIGVFGLHAGVIGVAVPSLVSRTFFAVVITILCFSKKNPVRYLKNWIVKIDVNLQKKILGIAVPNGIEYCRRLSVYCKCR